MPAGDRRGPRLRQSLKRHRLLPDAAGQARRGGVLARARQAGQTIRAAPVSVHESRPDPCETGTVVGRAARVRGGGTAGAWGRRAPASPALAARAAKLTMPSAP